MTIRKRLNKRQKATRRGRRLLLPGIALLFLFILLSYILAGTINSFFEGIVGEKTQAEFVAPFLEEFVKPFGLIVLAIALTRAKRVGRAGIDWLKSMRACYVIGYTSGLVFGLLENWISYGEFSGFRAATPFSHALEAGIAGVGIYYVMTRGRGGLGRLVFLYSVAVLLHFTWNNIESLVALAVLGLSEVAIGLAAFLASLQIELKRTSSAPAKRRRLDHGM